MAIDALWAVLIPKVSGVSEVQATIYDAMRDTPADLPKVSRVSSNDCGGLGIAVIGGLDTPDTLLGNIRYQREPSWILGCTLDTPATPKKINTEAHPENDKVAHEILTTELTGPKRIFRRRGPSTSSCEQTAARAYHAHHFNCHNCIAAGRDIHYGRRCAVGITLWNTYQGVD